jgi:hypothetical protein
MHSYRLNVPGCKQSELLYASTPAFRERDELWDVHSGVYTGCFRGLFGLHVLCRERLEAQKGLSSRSLECRYVNAGFDGEREAN